MLSKEGGGTGIACIMRKAWCIVAYVVVGLIGLVRSVCVCVVVYVFVESRGLASPSWQWIQVSVLVHIIIKTNINSDRI